VFGGVLAGLVACGLYLAYLQNFGCSGNDCNAAAFMFLFTVVPLFVMVAFLSYIISWCINIKRWWRSPSPSAVPREDGRMD
jgi:hypothetical protein